MTSRNQIQTLLILGAGGDLTHRLLLPGLGGLLAGERGRPLRVIGVGMDPMTESQWRSRVKDSFASVKARGKLVREVARTTSYLQADVTKADDLQGLLDACEGTPAIYFALPPAVTVLACEALRDTSYPRGTALVMEKPFGTDKKSALALNRLVASLVPEAQVHRVDHFLGRSDVLNVLGVRFSNRIFEPVWNNLHVDRIEIFYDESLALEGRAGYYDKAGALVDMIQSHLLQVLALMMMEVPATLEEQDLRPAMEEVLRATRLYGGLADSTKRARYTAGTVDGKRVPAYTREEGVDAARDTETLAQITVEVANWRWAGVPVVLRSGKALGRPRKEAVVTFKHVPHLPDGLRGTETPDTMTIGFKPPRLELGLDVNGPGDPFELNRVELEADLGPGDLEAYGEVLAGVLDNDPTLSVRGDTAVECWRIAEPVLKAWGEDKVPLETYAAGSDGPRGW